MNAVSLIGHVGGDPKRIGQIVVMNLATNERKKDGDKTNWHKLVLFGKTADVAEKYVKKGSKIAISGSIDYRKYNQDGKGIYSTDILVNYLELLDPKTKTKPEPEAAEPESEDDLPF